MECPGKRIMLLVEDMFNDLEFWYPYYRLKEAGCEVVVVGSTHTGPYKGKSGTSTMAACTAAEANPDGCDGVVVPGGYAPDLMRRYPAMVGLVQRCAQTDKLVAAICHAGWMLASAKILAGRRVTSFFAIRDDLVHAGAEWTDAPVVVDGNLITSRTPDDLPDFMRAIVAWLCAAAPAARE
jgi:protease I